MYTLALFDRAFCVYAYVCSVAGLWIVVTYCVHVNCALARQVRGGRQSRRRTVRRRTDSEKPRRRRMLPAAPRSPSRSRSGENTAGSREGARRRRELCLRRVCRRRRSARATPHAYKQQNAKDASPRTRMRFPIPPALPHFNQRSLPHLRAPARVGRGTWDSAAGGEAVAWFGWLGTCCRIRRGRAQIEAPRASGGGGGEAVLGAEPPRFLFVLPGGRGYMYKGQNAVGSGFLYRQKVRPCARPGTTRSKRETAQASMLRNTAAALMKPATIASVLVVRQGFKNRCPYFRFHRMGIKLRVTARAGNFVQVSCARSPTG